MLNFVRDFSKFSNLEGFDFILRLNKNKRLFEKEIEDLQNLRENNPKFIEYKKKFQELLSKYSEKNPDGSPILDPIPNQPGQGNFRLPQDRTMLDKENNELIAKYKTAIDKQTKLDTAFNESMNKEVFTAPFYIKEDMIPRNIKSEQMDLIFPFIKFKVEKKEPAKIELKKK